jgi:hypothetical protein
MRILLTAVAGALVALGCASSADAAVRVGTLRCIGAPKVGAIIASVQQARCVFTGVSGRHERYVAQFGRIGADIGVTNRSELRLLCGTAPAPSSEIMSAHRLTLRLALAAAQMCLWAATTPPFRFNPSA